MLVLPRTLSRAGRLKLWVMIFAKKFNIFASCVLYLVGYIEAISVSQLGDVRIEVTNDKWQCDRIFCPPDTHRCFISKHKDPADPSILVRTNICYSKDNKSLKQSVTTSKIDPNTNQNMQVYSFRNGVVSSVNSHFSSSINGFNEERFNAELNQDMQNMHANLNTQMADFNRNLNAQLHNIHANIFNMNRGIGRNIQTQMGNFGMSFDDMNHDLEHMFDY